MDTETLKDYRLTLDDWLALAAIGNGVLTPKPIHVEMLILAGLVTRDNDVPVLTSEGQAAASAMDTIFDWDQIAYVPEGIE